MGPKNLPLHRFSAFFIDLFLVYITTVLTLSLWVALYAKAQNLGPNDLPGLLESDPVRQLTLTVQLVYFLSYFTLSHWYFNCTVGKYFFSLKVTQENGEDLSLTRSFLRSMGYIVSGHLTFGLGFILAHFHKEHKTLHDILLKTKVYSFSEKESFSEKKAA